MRGTLRDIYTPDMADEPLPDTLRELASDASSEILEVRGDLAAVPDGLPAPIAALLYRVAREALRNVRHHADASIASLRAGTRGDTAWVEIIDNGNGFDPGSWMRGRRKGISACEGWKAWSATPAAGCESTPPPDPGTTVRAEVPWR